MGTGWRRYAPALCRMSGDRWETVDANPLRFEINISGRGIPLVLKTYYLGTAW